MIRFCPNCETERELSEVLCEGEIGGQSCNWDLTSVAIHEAGWRPSAAPVTANASASQQCMNGHPVAVGDLMCTVCGADVAEGSASRVSVELGAGAVETPEEASETVINGWRLIQRLPTSSAVKTRYLSRNDLLDRQAVLTLYDDGSEPDAAVYDVLKSLSREHVPDLIETGRWGTQAYEVSEELTGGTLADIGLVEGDTETMRRIVEELGTALHSLSQAGLRHRDLRPGTILVRERQPLDLVITGFGSARLSDYDLDIVSPLETTRYTAPEAIAGGVAAASDWWSLGMLLLEQVTRGACFEGVNEQAFLIHVMTSGVVLPDTLESDVRLLLRGLLVPDPRKRWQWTEVSAWLTGEPVAAPESHGASESPEAAKSIILGGSSYRSLPTFAIAAAESRNWDEARDHLARGVIAAWVEEAKQNERIAAGLRDLRHAEDLSDDTRLALGLKILHPAMPLVIRGEIVTPGWLLAHPIDGHALISGSAPDLLRRMQDGDTWLSRLKARAETVREKARALDILLNEEELKIHLLSTSKARLGTLWEDRRRLFPDTEHKGLVSLIERRVTTEEDLVLLLGAATSQFRTVRDIVAEAAETAKRANISTFDASAAETILANSRRDMYKLIEERLHGFSRSGNDKADEWADQFRLERRLTIARTLALLSIPAEAWQEPAKQAYVSTILDYFAKKVANSALRGPLARMVIGKWTPRVDMMELGSERRPAPALLEQILSRSDLPTDIDPAVFLGPETLERRLRSLHSHATLYRRDTGIDGLYLGFPFALMRDPRGNTKTRIAPVLLWPVRIIPQVGNRGHVSVSFDKERDEVRLNPAFEGLIGIDATRKWQEIANDILGRTSVSAADVMDAFAPLAKPLGRDLRKLPGKDTELEPYKVEMSCSGVLFHLAYMGQAIVEDLRHLKSIPPKGTGLESILRVSNGPPETANVGPVPEIDRYFTVASDPSQEAAVLEAREAPGLLIEGPPGTGKSQTIVNMVADALGRGKCLLLVCQKQAALEVVRKRLEAEGLGERLVMVTDMNRDRIPIVKSVREQLDAIFDQPSDSGAFLHRERQTTAARIESLEGDLDRHHNALYAVDDQTGLTYRSLIGELVSLEEGVRQPIDLPPLRPLFAKTDPGMVATMEEACGPLARYWLPAQFENSPLASIKAFTPDDATIAAFDEVLGQFVAAEVARRKAIEAVQDGFEIQVPEPFVRWHAENDPVISSLTPVERRQLAVWNGLFINSDSGLSTIASLKNLDLDMAKVSETGRSENASPVCEPMTDVSLGEMSELAAELLKPASFFDRINPGYWLKRKRLRSFLQSHSLAFTPEGMTTFLKAAQLEQARRPLYARFEDLRQQVPMLDQLPENAALSTLRPMVSRLFGELATMQGYAVRIAAHPLANDAIQAISLGSLEAYDIFAARIQASLVRYTAQQSSREALEALAEWMEADWVAERGKAITSHNADSVALFTLKTAHPTLKAYQAFRIRAANLSKDALTAFRIMRGASGNLAQLPQAELDGEVRRILSREARLAWKGRLEAAQPTLLFDAEEIKGKVTALATADRLMRKLNKGLLTGGINRGALSAPKAWEDITRLTGQRSRRLREFIDRGADLGLMELRPIWLMNPDIASRVLPLKSNMFDVVIYDEASQMPVEYALPTLFRGNVVIVSGDEKQMPPTSFFSSKVENDEADIFEGDDPEDDASEEERETFSETWNRREIKDCPDLLQLARSVLPTTTLQIHYRSNYRELIGFSNASFYGDRLSVPVRHPDAEIGRVKPIELLRVNTVYKDQTNQGEAEAIASILSEFWKAAPDARKSIGVVSFNRKQADLIEDVLEAKAERDGAFGQALAAERERVEKGEDMGFFVKNVENVQGDERDIIIFSTTFGRNAQGTFRRNFGVLGQVGGERRLNVAVTRARDKIIMVTSMPIGDISDLLTTRRAPATPRDYLQGYMEYARIMTEGDIPAGQGLLTRMVTERTVVRDRQTVEVDGVAKSVLEYLKNLGVEPIAVNDGSAFGLDYAIVDPITGLYGLGIECDAPRHRILSRARAREIWRPNVLRRTIPIVHRVSSQAWLQDGQAERQRLKVAVGTVMSREATNERA